MARKKLTRNEKRNPLYKYLDNAGVRFDSIESAGGKYTMQKNFTFDSGSDPREYAMKVQNAVPGSVVLGYYGVPGNDGVTTGHVVKFKIVRQSITKPKNVISIPKPTEV